MSSDLVTLGYVCICGEQVRVLEMSAGSPVRLLPGVTVSCSNGHVARFTSAQVCLLEPLVAPDEETAGKRAA